MKKIGLFIFLFALTIISCRKNIDEVIVIETPHVPAILEGYEQLVVPVDGSLTGFVVDKNGEPIEGANVRMVNQTTTTDEYGHFFFKDVTMNARGTVVQILKEGYFPGSRRFFAIENAENRVKIEMITKDFSHNFDAQSGATITFDGGSTIAFTPNSIQDANGNPYTGIVKVAAEWLDPSDYRTLDRMPGNLQGINQLSQEVVLGTYGMVAVELESEGGEKLNILEGETAKIITPIPSSMLANAPSEIPLWSYYEEYGMWVEEGVSTLNDGYYEAEVGHFSYWNHDFKDPLIEFTATFVDDDGNPLEDYKVVISQPGTSLYGYGHTCDLGIIMGLIPQDYDLLLEVLGVCGEVLYSQNIGPYSSNTDLGTITVPSSQLNDTTIEGELVDCDGNPVQNGVVIFSFDGHTVYEYTNGDPFSKLFSTCSGSSDIEVVAKDFDALLESDPIIVPTGGTTDLGQISVCDQQFSEYIRFIVDGDSQVYTTAYIYPDSISGGSTSLYFYDQATQTNVFMGFLGNTVGNYDGSNGNYLEIITDPSKNWEFNGFFDNFDVTEFGLVGEPIKGTFSGTFDNFGVSPAVQVSVTGDFNITRQ